MTLVRNVHDGAPTKRAPIKIVIELQPPRAATPATVTDAGPSLLPGKPIYDRAAFVTQARENARKAREHLEGIASAARKRWSKSA